MIKIKIRN